MTLQVTNSSTPCCKISNLIRTPTILGPRCKGHDSELMDHLRMFRVNYSVIDNQLLLLGTIFFTREHLSSTGNYTFFIHIPLSFSLPTLYRELALHQNIDVGIVPLVHYHELARHLSSIGNATFFILLMLKML